MGRVTEKRIGRPPGINTRILGREELLSPGRKIRLTRWAMPGDPPGSNIKVYHILAIDDDYGKVFVRHHRGSRTKHEIIELKTLETKFELGDIENAGISKSRVRA